MFGKLSTAAKVTPVFAVVAFFVRLTSSSRTIRNGQLVSCDNLDFFALFAAVVCLGLGAQLVRQAVAPQDVVQRQVRSWHGVIGAVLIVVAVVHVLRGLGFIGGPCP